MQSPAYWLVVPAAGSGQRMAAAGAQRPKQYLQVAGRAVIEHALAPFLADLRCQGAIVALAAGDRWWSALALAREARIVTVVGGAERSDSVARALAALTARVALEDPWVLVHDAVRPCVSRTEIDTLLAALPGAPDGALLALRLADTLKRATEAGRVSATLPRQGLWRALTPQAFRLRQLAAAIASAVRATDEANAVEQAGGTPLLVPGSPCNIKLTEAADLVLAARILEGGLT